MGMENGNRPSDNEVKGHFYFNRWIDTQEERAGKPLNREELLLCAFAEIRFLTEEEDMVSKRLKAKSNIIHIGPSNTPVSLTPLEKAIHNAISSAGGCIVTKGQLLALLNDEYPKLTGDSIEVHLQRMRKKVQQAGLPKDALGIATIRKEGYRLAD